MNRHSPNSGQVFPKFKIPVRIQFADLSTIIGAVFVRQGQRILDLMCDDRPFFPVSTTSGTILVNKSHVRQINVLGLDEISEIEDLLPDIDLDYIKNNTK